MEESEEQALESANLAISLHDAQFAEPIAILGLGATDIPGHAPIPDNCNSRSGNRVTATEGRIPGHGRTPAELLPYP